MNKQITYEKVNCSRWDDSFILGELKKYKKNYGKQALKNLLTQFTENIDKI